MEFGDADTSSTIYTWDTWSRIFRKIYKYIYRIHRIQEIQEVQETRGIQEVQEIDGGEGFAPQFRRKAGTPDVQSHDFFQTWGEALSSGLGFENLQGDDIPNLGQKRWVKILNFGENLFWRRAGSLKKMKCTHPKYGGLKFPTLARTYFEGGPVLSKKWSQTILNNIDLSSYNRFGIGEEDLTLRAPHLLMKNRSKWKNFQIF